MNKTMAALAIAGLLAVGTAVPAQADTRAPEPGFRVLPYLQAPAATTMTFNWISELDTPGTLTVTGPGVDAAQHTSTPVYLPLMEYSQRELDQEIPGLAKGSWLKSNSNYKHSVTVTGLQPGAKYDYTVVQDGREHAQSFRTAPTADAWDKITIAAFSDSETEPYGRVEHREWEQSFTNRYTDGSEERPGEGSLWHQKFGSTTRYGEFTLRYPLNQDQAMQYNLAEIAKYDPDLFIIAGDLTQGSGYQPAWDEFFGYVAGEHGTIAGRTPLLTALGNWETYAALNGGYGSDADRTPAVISRNRYLQYFDQPGNPEDPAAKGSYYRTDHGPVTVLTLDSTNGRPDENTRTGTLSGQPFTGDDRGLNAETMSTDTQGEFTYESYVDGYLSLFPGSTEADVDLPNFDPASRQWAWAEEQLADARAKGQIIIVQFHHAAYSIGVHGVPPNFTPADNQSGVAMRQYTPMFEEYGVSMVLSGHDEMFERSWVDEDGDGKGFHSYDIGVAADGLRGELMKRDDEGNLVPVSFNTHTQWSAIRNAPETWESDANGVPQLVDGGLHYGHLLIEVVNLGGGKAQVTGTPVYLFPVFDSEYQLQRVERRVYDDVISFEVDVPAAEEPEQPGAAPAKPGQFVRSAPYTLAGEHALNGRQWRTTCEPYSQTERCRTEILATTVAIEGGAFVRRTGWAFNNLTYLPSMTRAAWGANPLANAGEWTAETDGRRWRTECDTPATGGDGCRTYAEATIYTATPRPAGGYVFSQDDEFVFNNIVMFQPNQ
ncbi:hypothetical protein GCM10025789_28280 [Tessaracoccus lubricantis]|uniref:Calcineurin-like phosphoesterase domain-containing protein n=1 Tax=Tessaracoccus lubricantis TaxID=545543 RepID=A0ABP9FP71_9ACTN